MWIMSYFLSILEELTLSKQQIKNEKDRLTHYMEKARRMIEDLEEQNRAVEGGALSRHEFDSIRRERDAYKQNVILSVLGDFLHLCKECDKFTSHVNWK